MNTQQLIDDVRRIVAEFAASMKDAAESTNQWQDAARAEPLVRQALDHCLAQLDATGCRGEANRLPAGELWKLAGCWLETGWLQNHARCKPRGYAGDFEMFQAICQQRICEHPLGRHFDRYFQDQAAARAVRNRSELVSSAIVAAVRKANQQRYCLTSVGSGPAIDIERAIANLTEFERRRLEITLLDLDPAALDVARESLARQIEHPRLHCHRANLYRLPRLRQLDDLLGRPDFLFCIGFFDYLNESDAAAMLSAFWQHLAPGGELLVFNFSPENPSRPYMEWIGNWYLTERDASQMASLAESARIPPDCFEIGVEPSGVNLYLRAARKGI